MAENDLSSAFRLADPTDKEQFFSRLRQLDVNNEIELAAFLNDYKYRKLVVSGFNRDLVIVGRNESTVFDDFTLQVWKKYYIEEDVVQIGVLQSSLSFPVEVTGFCVKFPWFCTVYACSKSYHVFWLLIRWAYISVRKGSYKFISLYYLCPFVKVGHQSFLVQCWSLIMGGKTRWCVYVHGSFAEY